jgi:hypothetical protein
MKKQAKKLFNFVFFRSSFDETAAGPSASRVRVEQQARQMGEDRRVDTQGDRQTVDTATRIRNSMRATARQARPT